MLHRLGERSATDLQQPWRIITREMRPRAREIKWARSGTWPPPASAAEHAFTLVVSKTAGIEREGDTMRSMLKRRAALLTALVSVACAGGALGAWLPAAQAYEGYVCTILGSGQYVWPSSYTQLQKYEREGYYCFRFK